MSDKTPANDLSELLVMVQSYLPDAGEDVLDKNLDALGLTSMDFVSLVFDVEEKFDVEIDLAEVNMTMSIRQLIEGLK